jgi:predicted site-specific integrase-resolvase
VDKDDPLREAVAKAHGFKLYDQYNEANVAAIIKKDHTTLKRWRRAGKVPFVALGERDVRYFGYQIADMLIKGVKDE